MFLSYENLNSIYPIRDILISLGLEKITETSSLFKFSSPFREDREPSMVLYKKNLYCIDFSSGYKASLFTLIKKLTGQSFFAFTNTDSSKLFSSMFTANLKQEKSRTLFPNRKKSIHLNKKDFIPVENYSKALNYCESRSIFQDFRKEFDIVYTDYSVINTTNFYKRLCIPIVEENKIVSVEGRDITRRQKVKVLYPKGSSMSTLFNIDNLKKDEPLIIVEGILDIPKIWKFFTKNVTTTFGIMITNRQKELLLNFSEIILFPDRDKAGEKMISLFDYFYENEFLIAFLQEGDPGKASIKDLEQALNHTKKATKYFLEKSELFPKPQSNLFQFE